MSQTTSPGTGTPYGLEGVWLVLGVSRSTLYAQQARETAKVVPLHPARRGPKPKVSDADLLAAIRADLEASPFVGEGHRKVWARLRILSGIRVSKDRLCRLMRENALLSPHRGAQGSPSAHEGAVQFKAPNQRWDTDGIRIQTVEDGWVWVFSAGDPFDGCCVGIHAVKIGHRFAALQPSPRAPGRVWRDRRQRWQRAQAAHGSWHAIHRRRLPETDRVLGH